MNCGHPYPLFLSLAGRNCLVVGMGEVGRRKARGLLACGVGRLLCLDLRPLADLRLDPDHLLHDERLVFEKRPCEKSDVENSFLVFAATGDKKENKRIARMCLDLDILCDCASDPALGAFISPALAVRGELRAAFSTNGASPYLARRIRNELEERLGAWESAAWLMAKLRPLVLASYAGEERKKIFASLADSGAADLLEIKELDRCHACLASLLPPSTHAKLKKILAEYGDAHS